MKKEVDYHHGNLRTDLLVEGMKLLAREGYEGFSVRKLSGILGVTPMSFYRHFKTREVFLVAMVDGAFDRFAAALDSSVLPHLSPDEQLTQLCVAYVRFFTANPEILKVLFLETRMRDSAMQYRQQGSSGQTLEEAYGTQRSYLIFMSVARLIAKTHSLLDEEEVALAIWSRAHGLATLLSQESWRYDPERFSDESIERMIKAPL